MNPTKTWGELMCYRRVSSSCSTSGTCRVTLVTNPVISHEWGKCFILLHILAYVKIWSPKDLEQISQWNIRNQCHLHICESPFPKRLESMSFAHMWISFCPTFGIKFICTYVNLLLPKDHLYCKRSLKCVKNYDDRRQAIL